MTVASRSLRYVMEDHVVGFSWASLIMSRTRRITFPVMATITSGLESMNRQHRVLLPSASPPSDAPDQPFSSAGLENITNPRLRASHACDRCRLMRTKCSAEERCAKCVRDDKTCTYGDRKRERNRKYGSDSAIT
jgi:hypothetical protein